MFDRVSWRHDLAMKYLEAHCTFSCLPEVPPLAGMQKPSCQSTYVAEVARFYQPLTVPV